MDTPGMVKTRLLLKKAEIEARYAQTLKELTENNKQSGPDASKWIRQTESDDTIHSLEQEALAELVKIKLALKRLQQGEYTKCSRCGMPIPCRMLKAFPTTTLCFNCECHTDSKR
jgi:RNA polymerase-binding protein DksA